MRNYCFCLGTSTLSNVKRDTVTASSTKEQTCVNSLTVEKLQEVVDQTTHARDGTLNMFFTSHLFHLNF